MLTTGEAKQMQQEDIIMIANRRSQCQSNLQLQNTLFRKAMNMIMSHNRCSLTHPTEKPGMSKQPGSGGKQLSLPSCVCDI